MSHASRRMISRRLLYGCLATREEIKLLQKSYTNHSSEGNGPEYNYSLSGRGKRSQKSFIGQKLDIAVQGEVLYGIHPISLALRAKKRQFYQLYLKKNTAFRAEAERAIEMAAKLSVPVVSVEKGVLDKLSGSRPNQGMCMDVSELPISTISSQIWTALKESRWKHPIWLMPYNVQDPMNFGAILRTSYFLGIDHVLAPQKNSCRLSPVVSKASSGALEVINMARIEEEKDILDTLQNWKQMGGVVIAASTAVLQGSTRIPLPDLLVDKPVFLIVGNEEKGISRTVMKQCDQAVYIAGSDAGLLGSLNVSVATGIILHHLVTENERIQD
ncbi:rRNA methyltransferase 1, mitochondrial-like [Ostrea edulis]|uniref:rRNA methyltransferase 1, mitochondrial-like n=1 Tax=Ostrea edulis TaxID=37623 RepID=UPI0024AEA77A|nr:rRNA methyltransferase 1, mitochondrial-like [Ostrea edulis]